MYYLKTTLSDMNKSQSTLIDKIKNKLTGITYGEFEQLISKYSYEIDSIDLYIWRDKNENAIKISATIPNNLRDQHKHVQNNSQFIIMLPAAHFDGKLASHFDENIIESSLCMSHRKIPKDVSNIILNNFIFIPAVMCYYFYMKYVQKPHQYNDTQMHTKIHNGYIHNEIKRYLISEVDNSSPYTIIPLKIKLELPFVDLNRNELIKKLCKCEYNNPFTCTQLTMFTFDQTQLKSGQARLVLTRTQCATMGTCFRLIERCCDGTDNAYLNYYVASELICDLHLQNTSQITDQARLLICNYVIEYNKQRKKTFEISNSIYIG
jgi:hypothetical protein